MLLFSAFRVVLHVSVCFCKGNFVKMSLNLTLTTLFATYFKQLFNLNTENMQWLIKLKHNEKMFIRKIIKTCLYANETNECVIGILASDQMKPLDILFVKYNVLIYSEWTWIATYIDVINCMCQEHTPDLDDVVSSCLHYLIECLILLRCLVQESYFRIIKMLNPRKIKACTWYKKHKSAFSF